MSQYGPQPPPPPVGPRPNPVGDPPAPVLMARNLIFLSVGLSLLRMILVAFFFDPPDVNRDDVVSDALDGPTAVVLSVVGVAYALGFVAVWVLVGVFIMRAANWARVLVIVLGSLDLLGILGELLINALTEPDLRLPIGVVVTDVVVALLVVTATVLLWTAPSNRFFQAARVRPGSPPPSPLG